MPSTGSPMLHRLVPVGDVSSSVKFSVVVVHHLASSSPHLDSEAKVEKTKRACDHFPFNESRL